MLLPATESIGVNAQRSSEKGTLDIRSYLFYKLLEDIGAAPTLRAGEMQQQLYGGDFSLFKSAPVFESNFVQVSKKGHVSDIHHRVTVVTMGVSSTDPTLYTPDVLLIARPSDRQLQVFDRDLKQTSPSGSKPPTGIDSPLQLLRLFPLKLMKISIYDKKNHRLRLKLASQKSFYFQLTGVDSRFEDEMFQHWVKLVQHIYPQGAAGSTQP
ncbi:Golgi-associated RAB2 interactor protein 6-like isoform X1 [Hemitrygon akajei]|uniref:Golgi-associated RAB2 interactor protein 6-like isoform X1 n=2 Tax=Hemitrygon akajei TaxID=2704970 RepID=UPI003BFA2DF7